VAAKVLSPLCLCLNLPLRAISIILHYQHHDVCRAIGGVSALVSLVIAATAFFFMPLGMPSAFLSCGGCCAAIACDIISEAVHASGKQWSFPSPFLPTGLMTVVSGWFETFRFNDKPGPSMPTGGVQYNDLFRSEEEVTQSFMQKKRPDIRENALILLNLQDPFLDGDRNSRYLKILGELQSRKRGLSAVFAIQFRAQIVVLQAAFRTLGGDPDAERLIDDVN